MGFHLTSSIAWPLINVTGSDLPHVRDLEEAAQLSIACFGGLSKSSKALIFLTLFVTDAYILFLCVVG